MSNTSSLPSSSVDTEAQKPHIPRPPNSFMLYRKSQLEQMKAHPDLKALKQSDLSKYFGDKWKNEPRDVKDYWGEEAEKAKKKHNQLYPDYRFAPRRKKRKSCNNVADIQDTGDAEEAVKQETISHLPVTPNQHSQASDFELLNTLISEGGHSTSDDNSMNHDFYSDLLFYENSQPAHRFNGRSPNAPLAEQTVGQIMNHITVNTDYVIVPMSSLCKHCAGRYAYKPIIVPGIASHTMIFQGTPQP